MTNETSHEEQQTDRQALIVWWRCPNCGQTVFTTPDFEPPDTCAYCQDMTTWQRVVEDNHNEP